MMHRLATNCAKNCCNRTPIVKVIVENCRKSVTCFFGDTVYVKDKALLERIQHQFTQMVQD